MIAETFSKSKVFTALFLVLVGAIGRLFLINYVAIPNFEIITALTLVSAVYLGRIWGIVVPLSIIAITDVIIGNSPVLVFTWSAFAIIGVFGWVYKKYENQFVIARSQQATKQSRYSCNKCGIVAFLFVCWRIGTRNDTRRILGLIGVGIFSSVFFFLYTNFGWWLMTNMYPHTLDGLIQAYIMGLPFFKNNLIGNLIFVPLTAGTAEFAIYLKLKYLSGFRLFKIQESKD